MAATTTSGFQISVPAQTASTSQVRPIRRRISPRAGVALEKLGHAIEYLTDEFVHESCALSSRDGQLEAVKLLMAVNRQVYFECPEVPTLADRLRAFLRIGVA